MSLDLYSTEVLEAEEDSGIAPEVPLDRGALRALSLHEEHEAWEGAERLTEEAWRPHDEELAYFLHNLPDAGAVESDIDLAYMGRQAEIKRSLPTASDLDAIYKAHEIQKNMSPPTTSLDVDAAIREMGLDEWPGFTPASRI